MQRYTSSHGVSSTYDSAILQICKSEQQSAKGGTGHVQLYALGTCPICAHLQVSANGRPLYIVLASPEQSNRVHATVAGCLPLAAVHLCLSAGCIASRQLQGFKFIRYDSHERCDRPCHARTTVSEYTAESICTMTIALLRSLSFTPETQRLGSKPQSLPSTSCIMPVNITAR